MIHIMNERFNVQDSPPNCAFESRKMIVIEGMQFVNLMALDTASMPRNLLTSNIIHDILDFGPSRTLSCTFHEYLTLNVEKQSQK